MIEIRLAYTTHSKIVKPPPMMIAVAKSPVKYQQYEKMNRPRVTRLIEKVA